MNEKPQVVHSEISMEGAVSPTMQRVITGNGATSPQMQAVPPSTTPIQTQTSTSQQPSLTTNQSHDK